MTPKDDNPITAPAPEEETYSLEDILAEYGSGLERRLLRGAEQPPAAPETPEPEEAPAPETPEPEEAPAPETSPEPEAPPPEAPPPPEPEEPPVPETEIPAAPTAEAPPAAEIPAPPAAEVPPEPETPEPPETEEPPAPAPETVPAPETETPPAPDSAADLGWKAERTPPVEKLEIPPPQSFSLEDVVGTTVDAVIEEAKEPETPIRRRLFSRRPQKEKAAESAPPPPEPQPEPEPVGPEPTLWEAAHDARQLYIRRRYTQILPLVTALPPTLFLLLERYQIKVPYWSGNPEFQSVFLLACLGLTALLCRHVFLKGFGMLRRRRCVAELLVSLSVIAAGADCVFRLLGGQTSAAMAYAPVSCLSLVFAQWGVRRESKGNYDMLRAASMDDDPPYLVTNTPQGACKQRGSVPGFYTTASKSDAATLWQTALLPVFLAAAVAFALLSSVGQGRGGDFLLNLSAILPAAATFSLPLCWALPWSRLSEHLQKTGCAVAGWAGAQKISAQRRMIVTDMDLFPPGTVQLNGRKLFGETQERAVSLAASMARAAGSGLERLFNSLVRSEGGRYEKVDQFSFYEEGGWSGIVKGESVLMGGANFMRRMNVKLPADVSFKTGVFLAVDKELTAAFAVKYTTAENVDFALKMMQRSRIQPILASRDPNINPSLIRRKFSRGIRVEYPDLTERVALSEAEKDRDLPRALLFREGLLPYAEAVAGSLRLCQAVRRAAAISLLGSWAGTLLTFYLTSLGSYTLMNPLTLEVFLLLWTLPVLLMSDWMRRY